ncbi:Ribonuclease H-like domain containing protein [Parasponia andersonii]|uniref:Ribonuclease H-like domain containing protein n=1 Tax=Parasponia andersonii TaxID=3476 RepID=A0A2P5BI26_PARAD|nr:Ribonuclease H-like domain containing protein [Parasponia andersonii]
MDNSIAAIRNSVRYVRALPSRLARFKGCVKNTYKDEKALVCLDVPTRWNSTYLMLEHALRFVDAFKLLEEEDSFYLQYFCEKDKYGKKPLGPPMSKDWENCSKFCKFLKTFYEATLEFSTSLYITSNTYFLEISIVHGKLINWCSSKDSILTNMATGIESKI